MVTENTMAVTVPDSTQQEIDQLVKWADDIVVNSDTGRTQVLGIIKGAKFQKKLLDEIFNPNIKKAHELHKGLVAQKRQFTDRLDYVEKHGKQAVLTYDQEQEQIRIKEQRRLQAIVDEKARRERQRLEKEAEKLKTPELKEARLEEAAAIVAPVVQVAPPSKVKGVATKKTWKAKVVDLSKVPRQFLVVDMKALNALAKATKGTMKIEGVEFYEESNLAIG